MDMTMSHPGLHDVPRALTPRQGETLRFLVPTDFSAGADKALLHALSLAHQVGAEVHLLHVVTRPESGASIPGFPDLEAYCRHQDTVAMQHLRRLVEAVRRRGVRARPLVRHAPDATKVILDYANRHAVALTVAGTYAHQGGASAPLGRTAEALVRSVRGPVLTVAPHVEVVPGLIQEVLVPFDFSEPARHALALAGEIAALQQARVTVLHVLEPARQRFFFEGRVTELATHADMTKHEAHAALRRLSAGMPGLGDSVITSVVEGTPGAVIARLAERHHMIVQGAHGRTDIDLLALGQVAEAVIRTTPCPVITVKRITPGNEKPGVDQIS